MNYSQRIWDKRDYMFKMYVLIYYYLNFLKSNTYRDAINKEGSRARYNTYHITLNGLTSCVFGGEYNFLNIYEIITLIGVTLIES